MDSLTRTLCSYDHEATVSIADVHVIMGINGITQNPNRHAIRLLPEKARELAKLLNAAADFA